MNSSDEDVIERVLAGDHQAFGELVQRHNQRLFRAARSVTRDNASAEDALHAAHRRIWRN